MLLVHQLKRVSIIVCMRIKGVNPALEGLDPGLFLSKMLMIHKMLMGEQMKEYTTTAQTLRILL